MVTLSFARQERESFCDLIRGLGPEAPTLCTGWTTSYLAAHLVLRERRPDAAAGIVFRPLAGHTAAVQAALAAQPFDMLVEQVRHPPSWSFLAGIGPIDRAVNTMEFFVHTEDVRRAAAGWAPRELPPGLQAALWGRVRGRARLALRRFPAAVTLSAPGYGQAVAGAGGPAVELSGDPGELLLFLVGRQRASQASVTGPPEITDRLRGTALGI